VDLDVRTALDLEDGLTCTEAITAGRRFGDATLSALDHGPRAGDVTEPRALRNASDPSGSSIRSIAVHPTPRGAPAVSPG